MAKSFRISALVDGKQVLTTIKVSAIAFVQKNGNDEIQIGINGNSFYVSGQTALTIWELWEQEMTEPEASV